MDISLLNTNFLLRVAISALKDAYDECSDNAAKASIVTAFKAVIALHQDTAKNNNPDKGSEDDGDFEPGDYCAAV